MSKQISRISFPLFLIWPLGGFITSLFHVRSRSSAFFYVAFCMLFGYAISFQNDSADSYRYAQAFNEFTHMSFSDIISVYKAGGFRDIYRMLLFSLLAPLTNNPKVMYAIAGLVFGIFSWKSLNIFVKERGGKWDFYMFMLTFIFFIHIGIPSINGFRFWTGAIVLFYASLQFIYYRKSTWIIGILAAPLFHYSFLLFIPFIIIYRFIAPLLITKKGINKVLIFSFVFIFALSFVAETNPINLGFITESDIMLGSVSDRIAYVNSDKVSEIVASRGETSSFVRVNTIFGVISKSYLFLFVIFLLKLRRKFPESDRQRINQQLAFVIFLLTVGYFASMFPSGARFLTISNKFLFFTAAQIYGLAPLKSFKKWILLSIPVYSFTIAFNYFLLPIMLLSPTFWYGNLFWILFEGIGFTMK